MNDEFLQNLISSNWRPAALFLAVVLLFAIVAQPLLRKLRASLLRWWPSISVVGLFAFGLFSWSHESWLLQATLAWALSLAVACWKSKNLSEASIHLAGKDLDKPSIKFHDANDGQGTLTFLVGFAFAAAGVLGFAAQGQGQQTVLVLIYLGVGLLQISGIVHILRSTTKEGRVVSRSYNAPTISFGRWSLLGTATLSVSFATLALFGLIPGQQPERKVFEGPLQTTAELASKWTDALRNPGLSIGRNVDSQMGWWIERLQSLWNSESLSGSQRLVVVEQIAPFYDDFHTFTAQLVVESQGYELVDGGFVALMRLKEPGMIDMRQLHFLPNSADVHDQTDVFRVVAPEKGERLRLIVPVRLTGDGKFPAGFKAESIGLQVKVLE